MRAHPLVLAVLLHAPLLAAAQGVVLSHSGFLLGPGEAPVEGLQNVTIELYGQATGGTAEWSETYAVTVRAGYYAIEVGDTAGGARELQPSDLAGDRWLGVKIGGVALLPRHHLTPVPFAVAAGDAASLGARPASAHALLDGTRAFTGNVTINATPLLEAHAATKGYVDTALAGALAPASLNVTNGASVDTLVLRPRTGAPESPAVGTLYVDASGQVKVYTSGGWQAVGSGAGGENGDGAATIAGTIDLTQWRLGGARPAGTTADAFATIATAAVSAGATIVNVQATTGFSRGDEVLLLQLQGSGGTAGGWELRRVAGLSASAIQLTQGTTNTYSGAVLVQRVPNYSTFTVPSGATLTAAAWDGAKGGVVAVRATQSITIGGTVDVSALGFRGGALYNVNNSAYLAGYTGEGWCGTSVQSQYERCGGGGGGYVANPANHRSGGGGGGYGGAGANGTGQQNPSAFGYGAAAFGNALLPTLFFGGGGGGGAYSYQAWLNPGPGGRGGGIVLLIAPSITVTGTIRANGENSPTPYEAVGGAGAGGSIRLDATTLSIGANRLVASGGTGASGTCCGAAGGNGGLGRIGLKYGTIDAGAVTTPPFTQIP